MLCTLRAMSELRDTIVKEVTERPPAEFVADHLFDRVPHAFKDRAEYILWKRQLAVGLDVDPSDLTVVGSGATGISLSPYKDFREFDDESDIDVAVVSYHHFTSGWRYLRSNPHVRAKLEPKARAAWDDHRTRLIFWGTLATDHLLGLMPFGAAWMNAVQSVSLDGPTKGKEINLRIYADYVSLRAYQIMSVSKLRDGRYGTAAVEPEAVEPAEVAPEAVHPQAPKPQEPKPE